MRSCYLPSPGARCGGGHLDLTTWGLCLGLCDGVKMEAPKKAVVKIARGWDLEIIE